MNPDRHKRDLGLGHGEAYIGHCSAYGEDVRMLDTDFGKTRPHNECRRYVLKDKKVRRVG